MFSICSSDKNKCYEVINKLTEIYESDKEYLKVCSFETNENRLSMCVFYVFNTCEYVYVCEQLARVWLQLIQLKEEEPVDKKELVQLLQKMTQLLSDCLKEVEQDSETQQHVRPKSGLLTHQHYVSFICKHFTVLEIHVFEQNPM